MIRSELVARMAARTGMPHTDAALAVESLLLMLTESLKGGRRVEVRGFGVLGVKTVAARRGRNPKTGEEVDVPERRRVYFRPGKPLRDRLNSV